MRFGFVVSYVQKAVRFANNPPFAMKLQRMGHPFFVQL
jgi:hypothetical protein